MKKRPVMVIVVPCFNEMEVLEQTAQHLFAVLNPLKRAGRIDAKSSVLFVDDGSQDETWKKILSAKKKHGAVQGIKLSKNFGHQNALLAGLLKAREYADCVVSIDGDLQQDEHAIVTFLEKFEEGYEIVYGVRSDRKCDSWFKRATAEFFYFFMHSMGVRVIKNHADYRLVSKKVLDVLAEHGEVMLFLRGIFTTLGFKTTVVYHQVKERCSGKSKYSLHKMLSFALNGITSFSFMPIRLVSLLGLLVMAATLCAGVWMWVDHFRTGLGVDRSLLLIWFVFLLCGVQLVCMGILGEYIGKVYVEVKKRPKYIVDQEI